MTMLELALSYAAQGFTILPVNPATKAPLIKNWTNRPDKGEFGSSKDLDQVTAWWTQWPTACVGLRTGKVNGIVVVDIDRHGHCDGFKTIRDFDGVDPTKTATVLSAGGGQHLYYAYAGELKSTTLGEGVDFLAEGRQVIAPGSVRADGKPYLFVNGHDLSALAPLPGSVLAKLKRSPGQQRLDDWSTRIEATAEGERHSKVRDACWSLAHDVVAGKLDETEFRSRIADMATTCRPPMDRLDVENSIESALRKVRAESRQEGQAGRGAGLQAAGLRAGRRAGAGRRHARRYRQGAARLCRHGRIPGARPPPCGCCIATRSRRPTIRRGCGSPHRCDGAASRPCCGSCRSWCRGRLHLVAFRRALLFRSIGDLRPTIMLDEADNAGLSDNPDLKIVLNEGTWRGAVIGRLVGDGHEPKFFPIFAPVVFAGIGDKVPGPLLDRSITLRLRRKLPSETKIRFDRRRIDHLTALGRQATRFALESAADLAEADPAVPDSLNDREMDGWRPLLAIADMAGGTWPEAARTAAVLLAEADEFDDEPALLLLRDCRAIFEKRLRHQSEEPSSRTRSPAPSW